MINIVSGMLSLTFLAMSCLGLQNGQPGQYIMIFLLFLILGLNLSVGLIDLVVLFLKKVQANESK